MSLVQTDSEYSGTYNNVHVHVTVCAYVYSSRHIHTVKNDVHVHKFIFISISNFNASHCCFNPAIHCVCRYTLIVWVRCNMSAVLDPIPRVFYRLLL